MGRGDRSLHVGREAFTGYVEWMAATYTVVPLRELVDGVRRGTSLRGLASITFDDAYAGVFRHAVPALRRLGLPATVFAIESASARPGPMWWDVLGDAGALTAALRTRCLDAWRGQGARITEEVDARPQSPLPADLLPADWSVIGDAADADLAIEAHTDTHPNLAALAGDEIASELTASREGIRRRLGTAAAIIAYPYGRVTEAVVQRAQAAGFTAGVTIESGMVSPGSDPFRIRRVNVPAGISLTALDCWAAGIRPPARSP